MPNASFEQQIRKSIETFVEELSTLVRHAAVQSVNEAFGGAVAGSAARRSSPSAGPARRSSRGGGRKKGEKRAPEDLVKLQSQLLAAIKSGPAQRMEQIARALKSSTQELALPAKKLIADGKIKTKGQRRATKYFPA